jgi:hypothetical protein
MVVLGRVCWTVDWVGDNALNALGLMRIGSAVETVTKIKSKF